MRTQEQIVADCEKRFAELTAELERINKDPNKSSPCRKCRWGSVTRDSCGDEEWHCSEPLVKGFGDPVQCGSWRNYRFSTVHHTDQRRGAANDTKWRFPMPCGPEKALFQPKLSWWRKLIAIFS